MLLNDFVEFGADQSQLMELCLLNYSLVYPTVRVLKTHTVGRECMHFYVISCSMGYITGKGCW